MQGIKIILSFVALVSVFLGSTSTLGTKDVELILENTINTIMVGVIDGTDYDKLSLSQDIQSQDFINWYNDAMKQWSVSSSSNESYSFKTNIESIEAVSEDNNMVDVEIYFNYDYERIILEENNTMHKYAIGSNEIGFTSIKLEVNYKDIGINSINPIYFTIK